MIASLEVRTKSLLLQSEVKKVYLRFNRYSVGIVGERLLVPLLNFSMLVLLPLALVPRRTPPALSNGNGQLMCFQRSTYERIGGHTSVKGSVIEDVELARLCKAAGQRMIFVELATAAYALAVVMRVLITLSCNRTQRVSMVVFCFLHPVSIVLDCLILLNSIRWHYRKAGIMWKGRYYKR